MNKIVRMIVLCGLAAGISIAPSSNLFLLPSSGANEEPTLQLPLKKVISIKSLDNYKQVSVKVEEKGKAVTYTGVSLRAVLAEMVPELKMDTMPEWKAINRRELVLEVMGADGYPGLVTVTEIACNADGKAFVLATQENGKALEAGVHLICKNDEAHVRWVRQVDGVKLFSVHEK